MDFVICSALLGFVWATNKRFRNCWFKCILYNNSNQWVKKMEEMKLKAADRIRQLTKEGQTVEIELRNKTDSCQHGSFVFAGDDFIEFTRDVESEVAQEDSDSKVVTAYKITTIVWFRDIRAFSIIEEGTTTRVSVSTKEAVKSE